MKKPIKLVHILLSVVLLAGCAPLSNAANTAPIYTAAAETIAVTLTYGSVQSTILAEVNATKEPTATPTLAFTETATPTATETLIPTQEFTATLTTPMISATRNTNCRMYPSARGKYQSALMVGQKVAVRGRLGDNSWWFIEDPEDSKQSCWVWNDTTVVEGDPALAQVITVPVTPYPSYSISGSVSPSSYSGVCPVTIKVTGKIKATAGSYDDIYYGWTTNFGVSPGSGYTEFDSAGSQSFSATFEITSDTSGYVRFHMYEPEDMSTGKLKLNVDCD